MTSSPVSTIQAQWVQVPNGNLAIASYLAHPSVSPGSTATFPAVVVIQEIFGVNSHIRDVTERIAREGYVAIAPAIYQRIAPGFETGYTPEDITVGRQYKDQTQADQLISDVAAAIAHVKTLPMVKSGSVGCIGFCFGGHVAYLAATLPEVQATASFYGAGITTMTPGGGAPTLSRTPEIQGTVYGFFGLQDASIPVEQVDQIEQALTQHQNGDRPHQIFRYPNADHGFFCDQRASYNPEAAADAWERVKELFAGLG